MDTKTDTILSHPEISFAMHQEDEIHLRELEEYEPV